MKQKKTIMIDIDDTVVDMINPWKQWYRDESGGELIIENNTFRLDLMTSHVDPLEFWSNPELYEDKVANPNAVDFVNKYKDTFNIIFCSWCFVEHKKSKEDFIKREFGRFPLIDTKYKQYVKCDIAIDDRINFLHSIKEANQDVEAIHYNNGNNSKVDQIFLTWDEIDVFIECFSIKH
jgi:5'(3')-deoxyribonucleotidase